MSLLNPSTETAVPIFPLLPKSPGESTGSLTNPSSNDLTNQSARLQGFNNHRALLLHNLYAIVDANCQPHQIMQSYEQARGERTASGRAGLWQGQREGPANLPSSSPSHERLPHH